MLSCRGVDPVRFVACGRRRTKVDIHRAIGILLYRRVKGINREMRRVEEECLGLQIINGHRPKLARWNIRGDMQSIVILTRQLCAIFVVVRGKVEAAPAEMVSGAEEASQGYPPRIHGEVVGEFPLELCLYSDRRSGDDPSPAGIITLECRDDPLYQPGVCFRCRCFQLSAGPGIRVEFLARLDAQWKEHS